MDRFFCVLALCALLGLPALLGGLCREETQQVFFSLLFPQLTQGIEWTATEGEARPGEAVLL